MGQVVQPTLLPGLYIKPDIELLKYIQSSHYQIPIKITGTGSMYDNRVVMATCQPSQVTAGYRPNFQKETNTIVLVADLKWGGYPPKMGMVTVLFD